MRRRDFIKNAALAIPLLSGPSAFSSQSFIEAFLNTPESNDKILVLIILEGGNDGLNTLIPIDQYSGLSFARGNILIPEKKVLPIYNSDATGLHPALKGLKRLYDDKKVTFVQGVGCPNPTFGHGDSIAMKMTAEDVVASVKTGWVGRYIDYKYPGFPSNYPTRDMPDPPVIRMGGVSSRASIGAVNDVSVAIDDLALLDIYLSAKEEMKEDSPIDPNDGLAFVKFVNRQTEIYAPVIKAAADKQKTLSSLYADPKKNALSDQLKTVASLIGGGLQTKVYHLILRQFDTHADQTDRTDPTLGLHAKLLGMLSEAIVAFEDDIRLMGAQDRVLGMTYSDFGRRIISNSSYGTDHGTTEPIILFGSKLKSSLIGTNPKIPEKATTEDNLPLQYDIRSIYASVLKGWMGSPPATLKASLFSDYPQLDLFV